MSVKILNQIFLSCQSTSGAVYVIYKISWLGFLQIEVFSNSLDTKRRGASIHVSHTQMVPFSISAATSPIAKATAL